MRGFRRSTRIAVSGEEDASSWVCSAGSNSTLDLLPHGVRPDPAQALDLAFGRKPAGVALARPAFHGIEYHTHPPRAQRFGAFWIAGAPDDLDGRTAQRRHVSEPRIIAHGEL